MAGSILLRDIGELNERLQENINYVDLNYSGVKEDQNGKKYYMVKNSWGTNNKYQGTWYISKAFAAYKTMNILVHKDAVPKAIAKKWR